MSYWCAVHGIAKMQWPRNAGINELYNTDSEITQTQVVMLVKASVVTGCYRDNLLLWMLVV